LEGDREGSVRNAKTVAAPRITTPLFAFSFQRSQREDKFANEIRDSPKLQRKAESWFHSQMNPNRL
jgi:hypothetical protein